MPTSLPRFEHRVARMVLIACAWMGSLCLEAQAEETALNSAFVNDREPIPAWGGIAGVGYTENFETGVSYSACAAQPLTCNGIINHPDPTFEDYSLQNVAIDDFPPSFGMLSPVFPLQTGASYTDIIIGDNTSMFQWCAANLAASTFNVRINFEVNGAISALQFTPGQCSTGGTFVTTNGTWSPGVRMRIGIEVQPGNICRLYKDGVLIFTGTDIAQTCNPADPDIGINNLRNFNSHVGDTATMTIDNISRTATIDACAFALPTCAADVDPLWGNGEVNVNDVLRVISTWSQVQNPPGGGPRPRGDCSPLPNGDCTVNITDLLQVISMWGPCL